MLIRLAPTAAERLAKAPTPRERAYGAAVEALFGEGERPTRPRAYADSLRALAERDPRPGGRGARLDRAAEGAFLNPKASWGAFPGHHRTDIQSGSGIVNNALLFGRPQKSVVRGPFAPFPRSLRTGELHTSPKPVWFVTNRTADETARRLAGFTASPAASKLPGILISAMRG